MHVKVSKIGNPVVLSNSAGIQETQFDVTFSTPLCQDAEAYLRVIHSSSKIDLASVKEAVSTHLIDVSMTVEDVYDFNAVEGDGVDSIKQLNDARNFYFEGRVAGFLSAGQGFVFKVGDFDITLDLRVIPDSFRDEDLDSGKWICFKAKKLCLWPPL